MTKTPTTLRRAIAQWVVDGATVALEGFTHLIPYAAGHEIIRQHRRNLNIIRMTPDILCDQLIGMGCVDKLVFSWGGNPGIGSLHRFRDAVENGWPSPLKLEEHSHAAMVNRYVAGASNLPFAALRAYTGSDLPAQTDTISWLRCPFTGEEVAAVPALNPDVGIVHAQQANRDGSVYIWGISGVQKEVILASRVSIVTVEEVVDSFVPRFGGTIIPHFAVDVVVEVPGGAHPSYAQGYSTRDNEFYAAWDEISRDREMFASWMKDHALG